VDPLVNKALGHGTVMMGGGPLVAFAPIDVDRVELTIMGVRFPDLATLDAAANGLGSAMFEGFTPTAGLVAVLRSYLAGEISPDLLPAAVEGLV
jgi:putative transcriptional regulator